MYHHFYVNASKQCEAIEKETKEINRDKSKCVKYSDTNREAIHKGVCGQ